MRSLAVLVCTLALTACSDNKPSESEIAAAIAFKLPKFIELTDVEIGSHVEKERMGNAVILASAEIEMRYKEDTFLSTNLLDGKVVQPLRKKGDLFKGAVVVASTKMQSGGWDIELDEFHVAPKYNELGKPMSELPDGSVVEGSDEFVAYKAEYLAKQEAMRLKAEEDALVAKAKAKQKVIDDEIALKKLIGIGAKYRGSITDSFGDTYDMTIKFKPVDGSDSKFTGERYVNNKAQCRFTFTGYIESDEMIFTDNDNLQDYCHPNDWRFTVGKSGVVEGEGMFGNSQSLAAFDTN